MNEERGRRNGEAKAERGENKARGFERENAKTRKDAKSAETHGGDASNPERKMPASARISSHPTRPILPISLSKANTAQLGCLVYWQTVP
jgi:hypothetical protein